ncbi:MAG: hypothetical protein KJO30_14910 [Boseongicola sp.]|jgi:uncharacterized protein YjiS (DUF1127 family)|nr:hypothetical protein [Boseongicola sp.]NNJ68050.1 hypothetical protein [Boseongicola sp.]
MTSLLNDLKKRRLYNQTVREISNMPLDVAQDLGIYKGEAHALAARAVYGK